MTRHQKTPEQRAQEALDVAQRKVTKLGELRKRAKAEYDRFDEEYQAALRRRNFLQQDPDLPAQQSTTPSTTGDAPA